MRLRLARPDDLPVLREIELVAGALFRDIDMAAVADSDPMPPAELDSHRLAGHVWVAADPSDLPVAYLVAAVVDGNLHIEQVSTHPRHARQGIGRALIEHAAAVAVAAGHPALTLTTFVEVPWNGPYYLRCGFHPVDPADQAPGLRAIRDHEAALGLDRWPRTCMRRALP